MELKIVSWNIWIDGNFEKIKDFLNSANADIIGLQEVTDTDKDRDIIKHLTGIGYRYAFAPIEKVWAGETYSDGPAIFSKFPIISSQTYNLSKEDNRGAVRIEIEINNKKLNLFSTHLTHTHQKDSVIQEEQINNLLKATPNQNSILMGDFNAIPESMTIQNAKKILIDTDPNNTPTWSLYPEGCSVCSPQKIDTRLDYIFTTPDIKSHSFKVEESRASDHLPISIIINI